MKFTISREYLLPVLQVVSSAVARNPTMLITANILLSVTDDECLKLTATDNEVQLSARTTAQACVSGAVTVPGRKFLDITKSLPNDAAISFSFDSGKATVRAGKSRFTLSTLPAEDFPLMKANEKSRSFAVEKMALQRLIAKTGFSMANGDVRYYMNGMLFEIHGDALRVVATDGHRLSLCDSAPALDAESEKIILPRKSVTELAKILDGDGKAKLTIGESCFVADIDGIVFASKIIDGRYPEYGRVVPVGDGHIVRVKRLELLGVLQRMAIVANDQSHGVKISVRSGSMAVSGDNGTESGQEEIEAAYDGEPMEMGFNVGYLQQALAAVDADDVGIRVYGPTESCRIDTDTGAKYVVMPMRL